MAEESKIRVKKALSSGNPNTEEIAGHLEEVARDLHESGYINEASYLVKWAGELRQKNTWGEY